MSALPEDALRLLTASALGMGLGLTRDVSGKPAGMRTMGLVALGSATVALTALHQFAAADVGALSRAMQGVIQGVLTGVGFIGAGVVLHKRDDGHVHGLTTAAIVWVAATLGISCAVGAWTIVLAATAAAFIMIVVLHPLEQAIERRHKHRNDDDPAQSGNKP